jgi:hypothetical protein
MSVSLLSRYALCAVVALVATGCGVSEEAMRKAAQSNADKYYELVKLDKFDEAYQQTFSTSYKLQMPIEIYTKFQKQYRSRLGQLEEFEVAESTVDTEAERVSLTYSLKLSSSPEPVGEIVRLKKEGSEWRIDSVEPRVQRPK